MKTMSKKSFVLLGCLIAIFAAPLFAQNYDEIELTRSVIQTERKAIIAQSMAFSKEESEVFWPVYKKYQAGMSKIGDRMVKLIINYAKNYENLSDKMAEELLDDFLKIEKEKLNLKSKYVKEFRKILSPQKVTRFFQVENKLDAIISFDLAQEFPLVQ